MGLINLNLIGFWRMEETLSILFLHHIGKLIQVSDFQGTSLLKSSYITNIMKMI